MMALLLASMMTLSGSELVPKPAPPPSAALKLSAPKVFNLGNPSAEESKPRQADARLARAGFHRQLKENALKNGKWEKKPAGLWRLSLRSPGATSLRVHFKDVNLGAARLWVHDGKGQVFGPYANKGPLEDGDFWSDIVSGDTVTLELQAAAKLAALPFRILEVSHLKESGN